MTTAIKMNEEDQNTILTLRAEIDNCWIIVDDSQEKEAEVKEKIKYIPCEATAAIITPLQHNGFSTWVVLRFLIDSYIVLQVAEGGDCRLE